MSLIKSLRSEILKTKRTGPLYFTLAAAAFAPFMSMLDILLDGVGDYNKNNILNDMLIKKFQMTGLAALPLFLILVCTLLPQIEFKNNTWKQVLTSPQTKVNVFATKFINVQLLILVFFITNLLLMYLCAGILHLMNPSFDVLNQSLNGYNVLMARVNTYLSVLAICCIQFWLGLKFKNFIVPIAIGIACWFAGTILVMQDVDFAFYFPYSFHAYGRFPKYDPLTNPVGLISFGYAVSFLIVGYLDFKRRRMNA
ncbi:MAG TPA: ABC transporter permease [Chitinophagaceae bacterium]|nr:ABC transporter permease [Chitinophagaceae bacterium]